MEKTNHICTLTEIHAYYIFIHMLAVYTAKIRSWVCFSRQPIPHLVKYEEAFSEALQTCDKC